MIKYLGYIKWHDTYSRQYCLVTQAGPYRWQCYFYRNRHMTPCDHAKILVRLHRALRGYSAKK